jgi:hypothetical protein
MAWSSSAAPATRAGSVSSRSAPPPPGSPTA